jgi:hypothetical protein
MSTPPALATATPAEAQRLPLDLLAPNPFSLSLYGEPDPSADGLLDSIRARGVLVPLVVAPMRRGWEILSGHRRFAAARLLGLADVPCQVVNLPRGPARDQAVLDHNIQRPKTFSQRMREADALEALLAPEAATRRVSNLRQFRPDDEESGAPPSPDRRNSDGRPGRTDERIARSVGLGGKDIYRQARALWRAGLAGDPRAQAGIGQIDAGTKTIHAAYKDLRRRDKFTTGFRPTPYDVWSFRHDRAYGVPHPGSIPAGIVAHALHYFTQPGDLVVDPMAGGGTTLDVCEAMGRRCLAYDLDPVRDGIAKADVRSGMQPETSGCALVFLDPPYHTMLSAAYARFGVEAETFPGWTRFLETLARFSFAALRPGGHVAMLVANQTEKDLPAGLGYIDHAFLGYQALIGAGFLPQRRISCPMDGAYLPQQVRRAREDGRMLGQVRDLLVMRKPLGDLIPKSGIADQGVWPVPGVGPQSMGEPAASS